MGIPGGPPGPLCSVGQSEPLPPKVSILICRAPMTRSWTLLSVTREPPRGRLRSRNPGRERIAKSRPFLDFQAIPGSPPSAALSRHGVCVLPRTGSRWKLRRSARTAFAGIHRQSRSGGIRAIFRYAPQSRRVHHGDQCPGEGVCAATREGRGRGGHSRVCLVSGVRQRHQLRPHQPSFQAVVAVLIAVGLYLSSCRVARQRGADLRAEAHATLPAE